MATSKVIKEIVTDVGGNTTIEYSDDTTQKYNVADVVTAQSNPITGGLELSAGGGKLDLSSGARPDGIITKRGRPLALLTAPNQTIGATGAVHSLTTERPRFASHTRKMTVQADTQCELRFPLPSPVTPDASDVALSIDIYIDGIPDPFTASPNNDRLSVMLSNGTSAGSNFTQYIFDAAFMRQGWNTLKFRADDVNNTKFVGNMAFGSSFNKTGTGLNWALPIQYVAIQATNMNGFNFHIDDLRQPARAKPVLIFGFDDSGSELIRSVIPLFDSYGIKSYVTFTKVYEEENAQQGAAWERLKTVYAAGWDVINHTWSHGATTVGRSQPVNLSRTSNVVTVGPLPSDHGIGLNQMFKGRIVNSITADMNGVFSMFANTANTFQYTAVGANGTATADIRTMLADVFDTDTPENRRLLEMEITGCTRLLNTSGFARNSGALIWPNNSVPKIEMAEDICRNTGIHIARGARGGYTPVNELGVVGSLECGSFDMDSGPTSHNRVSGMTARIQGAIDRGEHLWIYGHFIQLWGEAGGPIVDPDAPPGVNGNPNPPAGALSGTGGWWYYEMLEKIIRETVGPAIARGDLLVMSPSEYVKFMGLPYRAD